jgi:Ca-activated chloride channel family protein
VAALAVAAAGAAAIAALYFLRLRRRRVVVAFAPLWLGTAGDPRASRRVRRLRHWLSLALALAIFAALWGGALDPRPAAVDQRGRSVVVLIDRSASMSATDEPGTRLGAAKREATRLLGGLGPADRALVASFADEAEAESGFEADPARLARAVTGVPPSAAPADLPRALAFAGAVLRGRPRPVIVLVSDGGFTDDARRAPEPRRPRRGRDRAGRAELPSGAEPRGRRDRERRTPRGQARAHPRPR